MTTNQSHLKWKIKNTVNLATQLNQWRRNITSFQQETTKIVTPIKSALSFVSKVSLAMSTLRKTTLQNLKLCLGGKKQNSGINFQPLSSFCLNSGENNATTLKIPHLRAWRRINLLHQWKAEIWGALKTSQTKTQGLCQAWKRAEVNYSGVVGHCVGTGGRCYHQTPAQLNGWLCVFFNPSQLFAEWCLCSQRTVVENLHFAVEEKKLSWGLFFHQRGSFPLLRDYVSCSHSLRITTSAKDSSPYWLY